MKRAWNCLVGICLFPLYLVGAVLFLVLVGITNAVAWLRKWAYAAFCVALAAALSGCATAVVRNPWSDIEIESVYQPSRMAAGAAAIVAFPQMMSDCPRDYVFDPVNVISVPLGLVVLCDAVVEAAVDTVCLPVDWPLSSYRERKRSGGK